MSITKEKAGAIYFKIVGVIFVLLVAFVVHRVWIMDPQEKIDLLCSDDITTQQMVTDSDNNFSIEYTTRKITLEECKEKVGFNTMIWLLSILMYSVIAFIGATCFCDEDIGM